MTLSDLLYIGALLAAVIGVALLVGAFLGLMAAVGAALLAMAASLFVGSRAVAVKDDSA